MIRRGILQYQQFLTRAIRENQFLKRLNSRQENSGNFVYKPAVRTYGYSKGQNTTNEMDSPKLNMTDSADKSVNDKLRGSPQENLHGNKKDNREMTTGHTGKLSCVQDYEQYCHHHLDPSVLQFILAGSMTEITKDLNQKAFSKILINPRHLVDVSHLNMEKKISVTGEAVSFPVGLSPTALHGWVTPEGERATVRAAKNLGIVYISSLDSTIRMEDIGATEPNAIRWQQIYFFKDFNLMCNILERAKNAGVTAIVLTIDKPRHMLNWALKRGTWKHPQNIVPNYHDNKLQELATAVTWDDVSWLCEQTTLPVILKGVLTPEDARMAVQVGAKAVIVSNHGGRAIDCLPATMDCLQNVIRASEGQLEVYLDGGINTGLDVFKALAYGADLVFIGRAALWGLGHSGQAGLEAVLTLLKEELINTMVLAGTPSLQDINMERIFKN